MTTISDLDARDLAEKIRTKALSPVEVLDAHLDAIARLNPKLNAVCTVAEETARRDAEAAERAVMDGADLAPLHGLPVGIKDVTDTAGIRTTYGSPLYADHVPGEDALVVRRLKAAGAIVIGKTNTPEFAVGAHTKNEVFGVTRNPWNPALSAGGSTGGGAAALAARMIPLAEGSDFGGSLRLPAAFCGTVGLRPTPGLVPTHPSPLPWNTLDVTGPMARNAGDVALLLGAMAGQSALSPIGLAPPEDDWVAAATGESQTKRRLAYVPDISGVGIDPEIEAVCRKATERLEAEGHQVETPAVDLAEFRETFLVLRAEIMVARFADDLDALDRLGANIRGNVERGLAQTPAQTARAERERAALWHKMRAFFETYDALLTPCVPVPPFPVEWNHPETIAGRKMDSYIDWGAATFVVSLMNAPAVSVPAGLDPNGLPVGLQIVTPRSTETRALGLAMAVEALCPVGAPGTRT